MEAAVWWGAGLGRQQAVVVTWGLTEPAAAFERGQHLHSCVLLALALAQAGSGVLPSRAVGPCCVVQENLTSATDPKYHDVVGRSVVEILLALVCRPEALAAPGAGPEPGAGAADAPAKPPAKRASTRASSRGAGGRTGGSGGAPAAPAAAGGASPAAAAAGPDSGSCAQADTLLLMAVGWCQRWLTRAVNVCSGIHARTQAARDAEIERARPG